jgi:hypothetical protein
MFTGTQATPFKIQIKLIHCKNLAPIENNLQITYVTTATQQFVKTAHGQLASQNGRRDVVSTDIYCRPNRTSRNGFTTKKKLIL